MRRQLCSTTWVLLFSLLFSSVFVPVHAYSAPERATLEVTDSTESQQNQSAQITPEPNDPSIEQMIVKFKEDVNMTEAKTVIAGNGDQLLSVDPKLDIKTIRISDAEPLHDQLQEYRKHPLVEYAEPDYPVRKLYTPNDTRYPSQWHLPRMNVDDAWNISKGKSDIIIAVVDTGVDANHPDLASKLVPGYNITNYTGNTNDDDGHGTHVAGIAAAVTDNNLGTAGVCIACRIMPIKVLDAQGEGTTSDVAEGIRWAADNGADVINLSLGTTENSIALQEAINYARGKGCVLVAAAGNDGLNEPNYPAANTHVIGVAATDRSNLSANFSNYGTYVDISAPGVDILSTTDGGGYGLQDGTSMASPSVAGVAALMLSLNPNLTPAEIERILEESAKDLGPSGWDEDFGYGLVDAEAALRAISGVSIPPTFPSSLNVDNISMNAFTLRWNVSTDDGQVVSYLVYLDGKLVEELSANYTGYQFTGLVAGKGYKVAVRARDNDGNLSEFSPVLDVTTAADTTPPTAPLNLVSSAVTDERFTVSWSASTDNVQVAGYFVYVDGQMICWTEANQRACTISELNSDTAYAVVVRALDIHDNLSSASTVLTIRTAAKQLKLLPPVNLSLIDAGGDRFTVSWEQPSTSAPITGYQLYLDGESISTLSADSTGVTVIELDEFTWYEFSLRAFDGNGLFSPESEVLSIRTADVSSPDAPTNLRYWDVRSDQFSFQWAESADNDQVMSYLIYLDDEKLDEVDADTRLIRFTELEDFTLHKVQIVAVDRSGNWSAPSEPVLVRTADATAPTRPEGLRSTLLANGTSVTLNWNAARDNAGVAGYKIYRNGSLVATVKPTNFTFNGLSAGTNHQITIRAFDAAGNHSAASSALTIKLRDFQPPSAPTSLTISGITGTGLTLNWTAARDNVGVSLYEIVQNGKRVATTRATSIRLTNLKENAVFSYTVRALDAAGNRSANSNAARTQPTVKWIGGKQLFVNFYRVPIGSNAVQPMVMRGQTLVPAKLLLESMGFKVTWDNRSRTMTGTITGSSIRFTVGNQSAVVKGKAKPMGIAPQTINGTLMVPLSFVAREAGYGLFVGK